MGFDLSTLLLLLAGPITLFFVGRRLLGQQAQSFVLAAVALHVVSAVVQVWLTESYYGGGDMFLYHSTGRMIERWLSLGPSSAFSDARTVLFGGSCPLPFRVVGMGSSTASMSALSGFVQYVVGNSLLSSCLFIAFCSLGGKFALARALSRLNSGTVNERWLLFGCLLTPSMVYWTSAFLKESVAVAGLGPVFLGAVAFSERRLVTAFSLIACGGLIVMVFKPYLLVPWTLFAATLEFRRIRDGRPVELDAKKVVLGTVVAFVGVGVLGRLFPQYSVSEFVDTSAHLQHAGKTVTGGSNFELGSAPATTLLGQLAYAPLALLTTAFRPFLFEVRNAQMAVSALETTVFLVIVLRAFWRAGIMRLVRATLASPLAASCAIFVFTFGTAVGLSTTNLGTLSRYRAPMLPFMVVLCAYWLASSRRLSRKS